MESDPQCQREMYPVLSSSVQREPFALSSVCFKKLLCFLGPSSNLAWWPWPRHISLILLDVT
eukprot:scaffold55417_cov21-Tisochrysis_lutea.AAC.1